MARRRDPAASFSRPARTVGALGSHWSPAARWRAAGDLELPSASARRPVGGAMATIHRYREPGKMEHYATQDALLGGALRELGELEKELERRIVLGQYEEAGPRHRYEEVRRRLEEEVFGVTRGWPGTKASSPTRHPSSKRPFGAAVSSRIRLQGRRLLGEDAV